MLRRISTILYTAPETLPAVLSDNELLEEPYTGEFPSSWGSHDADEERSPENNAYDVSFVETVMKVRPKKVLKELLLAEEEADLDPNKKMTTFMYGACLVRMGMQREGLKTLDILKRMSARGLKPNSAGLSSSIRACGRSDMYPQALALHEKGILDTNRPARLDHHCVAAAISACSNAGEIDKALSLLHNLRSAGMIPHIFCFTAAIMACGDALRPDKAVELADEIYNSLVEMDGFCANALVTALGKSARWKEALEVYFEMEQVLPANNTVRLDSLRLASLACGRRGDWKACIDLIVEMRAVRLAPDNSFYEIAMKACGKAGQGDKGLELFAGMAGHGAEPGDTTYDMAIKVAGMTSQWNVVLTLFDEMRARYLQPSLPSYR